VVSYFPTLLIALNFIAATYAHCEVERFFDRGEATRNTSNPIRDDRALGSDLSGGYKFRENGRDRADAGRFGGGISQSGMNSSNSADSSQDSDPNTFGTSAYYNSFSSAYQPPVRNGYISYFTNGRYYWVTPSQYKQLMNIRSRNYTDHERQEGLIVDLNSAYRSNPGVPLRLFSPTSSRVSRFTSAHSHNRTWFYPYLNSGYQADQCVKQSEKVNGVEICERYLTGVPGYRPHSYIIACVSKEERLPREKANSIAQKLEAVQCVDFVDGPMPNPRPNP
jgi:hypothetical protein